MNLTISNFLIEKIYGSHFLARYITNQLHEVGPFFSSREYFNSSRNSRSFIKSNIYYRPHESLLVNLVQSLVLHPPFFRRILTSLFYLYRFIPISLFSWRFLLEFSAEFFCYKVTCKWDTGFLLFHNNLLGMDSLHKIIDKSCQNATLSATNPTLTGLDSRLGFRCWSSATNNLSHGTTQKLFSKWEKFKEIGTKFSLLYSMHVSMFPSAATLLYLQHHIAQSLRCLPF
jgi:hypothetical protein